jgi:DNA-binding response OmpR family regulator
MSDEGRQCVLVVDDDEAERSAIADLMQEEGFDVVVAEDGEVALRVLEEGDPPGLVLLDLMMPRVNGWQVLEAMERSSRLADIPVIVLTAFSQRAGLPGGCRVLHKPFEREVLLAEAHALTRSTPTSAPKAPERTKSLPAP